MTTRRAKDDSVFHQRRYASSPEFERGLLANLVAKRVSILDDKTDRELIWFLQYLSQQDGGMAAVAADLLEKYPERFGTTAMVQIGKGAAKSYNSDEVRRVRNDLPKDLRLRFPLRGETDEGLNKLSNHFSRLAEHAKLARAMDDDEGFSESHRRASERAADLAVEQEQDREKSSKYPTSYPAIAFLNLCHEAAERGFGGQTTITLERELCRLCIDPSWILATDSPWYFAGLISALREYHEQWILEKSGAVVTAVGKKVYDTLDYTLHSRSLSLIEGKSRRGKSTAAKNWCLQHPGQARYVEVPPSNDETHFFRSMARSLGLGCSLQKKLGELREGVNSVLLTGDLLLVLDEAHRLWPQRNPRYCFPNRINFVMAMANDSVPICMVSTPQFIESQKAADEKGGWNSAQLTGRIGHYELLPESLEVSDLMAVGKYLLPEADSATLRILAAYARKSARYLAAIEAIAKRAKYMAQRAGRTECSADDVLTALRESVLPSDTRLVRTLEATRNRKPGRRAMMPAPEAPAPIAEGLDDNLPRTKPACSDPANRIAALAQH